MRLLLLLTVFVASVRARVHINNVGNALSSQIMRRNGNRETNIHGDPFLDLLILFRFIAMSWFYRACASHS